MTVSNFKSLPATRRPETQNPKPRPAGWQPGASSLSREELRRIVMDVVG